MNIKDPFAPLDQYEKDLIQALEKDEFVEVEDTDEEKRKAQAAAKNTLEKVKNINIRLSFKDIQQLKVKAAENGMPYQTLVASVLHQYADDRVEVRL
ncbi:MAG: antitoxin [Candidatus Pacebacteria bacterium CG_4_10_14_0_8_um_filter_43_12]|nr:MAG: antitoxin [Candidatus Pacebacteria bacterium CG_4_10_14_0_8_um_filter_43_12]